MPKEKKQEQQEEEEPTICSWCGEDCSDGCYTRIDDKPVCDACKETL